MAQELDAIQKAYDLTMWALDRVGSFPKDYKICLGDRVQTTMHSGNQPRHKP